MNYLPVKHHNACRLGYRSGVTARRSKNPETMATLAGNLRGLMDLREWSEYDLAKASGVAQKTINNVLNQRSACTVETAELLAQAFNLSGWQLLLPGLPAQVLTTPTLGSLVSNWVRSSTEGRSHISRVADREARYTTEGAAALK